ncbi:MAG: YDG domain-containing protein [Clostridiales bacterium]|nr:YDG domain-containing protein [Clostridiales bacterium]
MPETGTLTIADNSVPVINTQSPITLEIGESFTEVLHADGLAPITWEVEDLPTWIAFDGFDTLSGTAPDDQGSFSHTITVKASNPNTPAGAPVTKEIRFNVSAPVDPTDSIFTEDIVATAVSRFYDGTDVATVTFEIPSDSIFATIDAEVLGVASFSDKNVEDGKTVTIDEWYLDGPDDYLYLLPGLDEVTIVPTALTADIWAYELTYNVDFALTRPETREYDGTNLVSDDFEVDFFDVPFAGDVVELEIDNAVFANADAGVNKLVSFDWGLTGADADNYDLPSKPVVRGTIEKKELVVTNGSFVFTKPYDTTTTVLGTDGNLYVGGVMTVDGQEDDVTVTATATEAYPSENARSTPYTIPVSIAMGGTASGNYALSADIMADGLEVPAYITKIDFTPDPLAQKYVKENEAARSISVDLHALVSEKLADSEPLTYTIPAGGITGNAAIVSLTEGPVASPLTFDADGTAGSVDEFVTITVTIDGFTNYNAATATVTVTIVDEDTEIIDFTLSGSLSKTYDGLAVGLPTVTSDPDVGLAYTLTWWNADTGNQLMTIPRDVGAYNVKVEASDDNAVGDEFMGFNITQRQVFVVADPQTADVGGTLPEPLTYTLLEGDDNGFVFGDKTNPPFLTEPQPVYDDGIQLDDDVILEGGSFLITFDPEGELDAGLPRANYKLVHEPGTLTIRDDAPPFITTESPIVFEPGETREITFTATGAKTITWTAADYPNWLTWDADTATLSGTAPDDEASTDTFTVTATNDYPPAHTKTFTLNVSEPVDPGELIEPGATLINPTAWPKTYDGTKVAEVTLEIPEDSLLDGQGLEIEIVAEFGGSDVGLYQVTIISWELKGDNAYKYKLPDHDTAPIAALNARITQLDVLASDFDRVWPAPRPYDGTDLVGADFAFIIVNAQAPFADDDVEIEITRAVFADSALGADDGRNAGTNKPIDYDWRLIGEQSNNYNLSDSIKPEITGTIQQRLLAIGTGSFEFTKPYDGELTVEGYDGAPYVNRIMSIDNDNVTIDVVATEEYEEADVRDNADVSENYFIAANIFLSGIGRDNYTLPADIIENGLVFPARITPLDFRPDPLVQKYVNEDIAARSISVDLEALVSEKLAGTETLSYNIPTGGIIGNGAIVNLSEGPRSNPIVFTADGTAGSVDDSVTVIVKISGFTNYEPATAAITVTIVPSDTDIYDFELSGALGKTYDGLAVDQPTVQVWVNDNLEIADPATYNLTWHNADTDAELAGVPKDAGSYYVKVVASDANAVGDAFLGFNITQKTVHITAEPMEAFVGEKMPEPEVTIDGFVLGDIDNPPFETEPVAVPDPGILLDADDRIAEAGPFLIKFDPEGVLSAGLPRTNYRLVHNPGELDIFDLTVPVITTESPIVFEPDETRTIVLAATGMAPITWNVTGLPSWLTWNASENTLSGTAPIGPATTQTFRVEASNPNTPVGEPVVKVFTLNVSEPLDYEDLIDDDDDEIRATVVGKPYDGNTTANVTIAIPDTSKLYGLGLTINAIAEFDGKDVLRDAFGDIIERPVTVKSWSFAESANSHLYKLPDIETAPIEDLSAAITPRVLRTNVDFAAQGPADSRTYNGLTGTTVTVDIISTVSPMVDDEFEILTSNENFETADAGTDKPISFDWELSGDDAGNYSLPGGRPSVFGDIDPINLIVGGDSFRFIKPFDTDRFVKGFEGEISAFEIIEADKDDVTVSAEAAELYPSANVGAYTIKSNIYITGAGRDNYKLPDAIIADGLHLTAVIEPDSFSLDDYPKFVRQDAAAVQQVIDLGALVAGKNVPQRALDIDWGSPVSSGAIISAISAADGKLMFNASGGVGSTATLPVMIAGIDEKGEPTGFANFGPVTVNVVVTIVENRLTPVELLIPDLDRDYNGAALVATATSTPTVPAGNISYTWKDEYGDPLTPNTAPRNAGTYKVTAYIDPPVAPTEGYIGEMTRTVVIRKKPVIVATSSDPAVVGQKLPEATVSYDGFIGADITNHPLLTWAKPMHDPGVPVDDDDILIGVGAFLIDFEVEAELLPTLPGTNYGLVPSRGELKVEENLAPIIRTESPLVVRMGEDLTVTLDATGADDIVWTVENNPSWFVFDGVDTLSGIAPTTVSTRPMTVTATNSHGADKKIIVVNVSMQLEDDDFVTDEPGVVSAEAFDKTYNGNKTAEVKVELNPNSLLAGLTTVWIDAVAEFDFKDVGTWDVTIRSWSLGGTHSYAYTLPELSGVTIAAMRATISEKVITEGDLIVTRPEPRDYTGTTETTLSIELKDPIAGDEFGIELSGIRLAERHAGGAMPVIYNWAPTGSDAPNYLLLDENKPIVTAAIRQIPLTVDQSDFEIRKIFDGTNTVKLPTPPGELMVEGRLPIDINDVVVTAMPEDYPSAEVGEYWLKTTLALSGDAARNYDLADKEPLFKAYIDKDTFPVDPEPKRVKVGDSSPQSKSLVNVVEGLQLPGDVLTWTVENTSDPANMLRNRSLVNGVYGFYINVPTAPMGTKATITIKVDGFANYEAVIFDLVVEIVSADREPVDFNIPILNKIYDGQPVEPSIVITHTPPVGTHVPAGEITQFDIDGIPASVRYTWQIWSDEANGGAGDYVTYRNGTTVPKDAGRYRALAEIGLPSSTKFIGTATRLFTIDKKQVFVEAEHKHALVGQKLPEATVTYTGFLELGATYPTSQHYALDVHAVPVYDGVPVDINDILTDAGDYAIILSPRATLNDLGARNYELEPRDGKLEVEDPLTPFILTESLAAATVDEEYSNEGEVLTAAGSKPVVWSWTAPAGLEAWLTLNTATGGLSGTPTDVGSWDVLIMADNGVGTSVKEFTITAGRPLDENVDLPTDPATGKIVAVAKDKTYDATEAAEVTIEVPEDSVLYGTEIEIKVVAEFDSKDVGPRTATIVSWELEGPGAYEHQLPKLDSDDFVGFVEALLDAEIEVLEIGEADLDISEVIRPYDGTTDAEFTIELKKPLNDNFAIAIDAGAAFDTPDVGENKAINYDWTFMGGTDADNYLMPSKPDVEGEITHAVITVEQGTYEISKVFDTSRTAFLPPTLAGLVVDGIVGSEDVSVRLEAGLYNNANVSSSHRVRIDIFLTGTAMANYELANPVMYFDAAITLDTFEVNEQRKNVRESDKEPKTLDLSALVSHKKLASDTLSYAITNTTGVLTDVSVNSATGMLEYKLSDSASLIAPYNEGVITTTVSGFMNYAPVTVVVRVSVVDDSITPVDVFVPADGLDKTYDGAEVEIDPSTIEFTIDGQPAGLTSADYVLAWQDGIAPVDVGAHKVTVTVTKDLHVGEYTLTVNIRHRELTVRTQNQYARVGDVLEAPLAVVYGAFAPHAADDRPETVFAAPLPEAAHDPAVMPIGSTLTVADEYIIGFNPEPVLSDTTPGTNYRLVPRRGALTVDRLDIAPTITTEGPLSAEPGQQNYEGELTATGTRPITWTWDAPSGMTDWLQLDADSGKITNKPGMAAPDETSSWTFTVTATSDIGDDEKELKFNISKQLDPDDIIEPGEFEVKASVTDKFYDGNKTANVTITIPETSSIYDEAMAKGWTIKVVAEFFNENVGTWPVTIKNWTLEGDGAYEYNMPALADTPVEVLTAAINQKEIKASDVTITGPAPRSYDGTTETEIEITLNDPIAGDAFEIELGDVAFANRNVGDGKAINYTWTGTGSDAGNYLLLDANKPAVTGDVKHAELTVYRGSFAITKPYDTKTTVIDGAIRGAFLPSGIAPADENIVVVTGEPLEEYPSAAVGTHPIRVRLRATGEGAANYTLSPSEMTINATITKAPAEIGDVTKYVNVSLGGQQTVDLRDHLGDVALASDSLTYSVHMLLDRDGVLAGINEGDVITGGNLRFDMASGIEVGDTATIVVAVGGFSNYADGLMNVIVEVTDLIAVDTYIEPLNKDYNGQALRARFVSTTAGVTIGSNVPEDDVLYTWVYADDPTGTVIFTGAEGPADAGTYKVTAEIVGDSGATWKGKAERIATIRQLHVKVTPDDQYALVGDLRPELTAAAVTYTGFIGDDIANRPLAVEAVPGYDSSAEVDTEGKLTMPGKFAIGFAQPAVLSGEGTTGVNYLLVPGEGELVVDAKKAPVITTESLEVAAIGRVYGETLEADGAKPVAWSWNAPADLRAWLTLNTGTGELTGMPVTVGTWTVRITADNDFGQNSKVFTISSAHEFDEGDLTDDVDGEIKVFVHSRDYNGTAVADVDVLLPDSSNITALGFEVVVVAKFADKNVGTGKAVTIESWHLVAGENATADPDDYKLPSLDSVEFDEDQLVADIRVFQLTNDHLDFSDPSRGYNGTNVAELEITLKEPIADDVFTIEVTATFADETVEKDKFVTYDWTKAGTDAPNYELPLTKPEIYGDIDYATLEVLQGDYTISKPYDTTRDVTTITGEIDVRGIAEGEESIVTVTPVPNAEYGGTNAGNYTIFTRLLLGGEGQANYRLKDSSMMFNAKITPAVFPLSNPAAVKPVNEGDTVTRHSVDFAEYVEEGRLAGDELKFSLASSTAGTILLNAAVDADTGEFTFNLASAATAFTGATQNVSIAVTGFRNYQPVTAVVRVEVVGPNVEIIEFDIDGLDIDNIYNGEPVSATVTPNVPGREVIWLPATGNIALPGNEPPTNVGSYRLRVLVDTRDASGDNGSFGELTKAFNIKPKHATITADNMYALVGEAAPVDTDLSYTHEGFIPKDILGGVMDVLANEPTMKFDDGMDIDDGKLVTAGNFPIDFATKATLRTDIPASNYTLGHLEGSLRVSAEADLVFNTDTELPAAIIGEEYSFVIDVDGVRPIDWALAAPPESPEWLTIDSDGKLTGMPDEPGTWTFDITVTDENDSGNTATRTFTLNASHKLDEGDLPVDDNGQLIVKVTDRQYDGTKIAPVIIELPESSKDENYPDAYIVVDAVFDSKDIGMQDITINGWSMGGEHHYAYSLLDISVFDIASLSAEILVRQLADEDLNFILPEERFYNGNASLDLKVEFIVDDDDPMADDEFEIVASAVFTDSVPGAGDAKNIGNSKSVTYTMTPVGKDAHNYRLPDTKRDITTDILPVTLVVEQGLYTITRPYDGTRHVPESTGRLFVGGIVGEERVSVVPVYGDYPSEDVGDYKLVANLVLSGVDQHNYRLPVPNTLELDAYITPKPFTLANIPKYVQVGDTSPQTVDVAEYVAEKAMGSPLAWTISDIDDGGILAGTPSIPNGVLAFSLNNTAVVGNKAEITINLGKFGNHDATTVKVEIEVIDEIPLTLFIPDLDKKYDGNAVIPAVEVRPESVSIPDDDIEFTWMDMDGNVLLASNTPPRLAGDYTVTAVVIGDSALTYKGKGARDFTIDYLNVIVEVGDELGLIGEKPLDKYDVSYTGFIGDDDNDYPLEVWAVAMHDDGALLDDDGNFVKEGTYQIGFVTKAKLLDGLASINYRLLHDPGYLTVQYKDPAFITTETVPGAFVGTPYSYTLQASGAMPITWSFVEGKPTWLNINPSTGTLSGTPTAAGVWSFTIRATNDFGTNEKVFTIGTPPAVTPNELENGAIHRAYEQVLIATGVTPVTWNVTNGELPPGITLVTQTGNSAVISGIPEEIGSWTFTVTAGNSVGSTPMVYTLVVTDGRENENISLTLSPAHIVLTEGVSIELDAIITNYSNVGDNGKLPKVTWSMDGLEVAVDGNTWGLAAQSGIDPMIDLEPMEETGGMTALISTAKDAELTPQTFRVRALVVNDDGRRYTTTSTVEILPLNKIEKGKTNIQVLDAAVTLNKALEVGATVPVLITEQNPADIRQQKDMKALSSESSVKPQSDTEIATGLEDMVEKVRVAAAVFPRNVKDPLAPGVAHNPQLQFTANISPTNGRMVEINTPFTTRNATTKNLVLQFLPKGAADVTENWITSSNVFSLKVVETWPKVTLRTEKALSLAFPNDVVGLTATSPVGRVEYMNATTIQSATVALTDTLRAKDPETGEFRSVAVTGSPNTVNPRNRIEFENGRAEIRLGSQQLPNNRRQTLTTAPLTKMIPTAENAARLAVKVEGFKLMHVGNGGNVKAGNMPRLNITATTVTTLPALRMSKTSIPLLTPVQALQAPSVQNDIKPTTIQLLSGNSKIPFSQLPLITDVQIANADARNRPYANNQDRLIAKYLGNGFVEITGTGTNEHPGIGPIAGTAALNVFFEGAAGPRLMPFRITTPARTALKPTNKSTTINMSQWHVTDADDENVLVATIPVTMNVDNLRLGTWGIIGTPVANTGSKSRTPAWNGQAAYTDALRVEPTLGADGEPVGNSISIWANKERFTELLKEHHYNPANVNLNMRYTIRIGETTLPISKVANRNNATQTFNVVLNIMKGAPTFTVAMNKTRMDISDPEAVQAASLRLTNVTGPIKSIELVERNELRRPGQTPTPSDLYYVPPESINGLNFVIARRPAIEGDRTNPTDLMQPLPNSLRRYSVIVTFENGQKVNSWTIHPTRGTFVEANNKTAAINPRQTASRATFSRNNASLYRSTPMRGEAVKLGLTTPVNVELGAVSIDPATVRALQNGGFRLEQSGRGEWSIYFADDRTPAVTNNSGVVQYNKDQTFRAPKASYRIRLQLWAEGTYTLQPRVDAHGLPVLDKTGEQIMDPIPLRERNAKDTAWVNRSKPTNVNFTVRIVP